MSDEILDIPGHLGYGISREGRVFSKRQRRTGHILSKWTELKTHLDKHGTVRVVIKNDFGETKNIAVRYLLALVFVSPPPSEYAYVSFINGDEKDISISNLKWSEVIAVERKPKRSKKKQVEKREEANVAREHHPVELDGDLEEVKQELN